MQPAQKSTYLSTCWNKEEYREYQNPVVLLSILGWMSSSPVTMSQVKNEIRIYEITRMNKLIHEQTQSPK